MGRSTVLQAAVWCAVLAGCNEDVIITAPPVMQVGIRRIEFGAVPVGSASSRTIVIQNSGSGDLRLAEPGFEDNGPGAYRVTGFDRTVSPGSQGTMTIEFGPPDIRRYESILLITGNDPEVPVSRVSLGGEGYRRGIIEVEPVRVDFGRVDAGAAAVDQVWIRSVGNGDLNIGSVELSPATPTDFSIQSSTAAGPLPAGQEVPILVAYRPGGDSPPPGEGLMQIRSDDPFRPLVEVTLVAGLNQAPLADAGPDQDTDPLETVQLDGNGSTDPDGDLPLAYAWTLVRRPEGSTSALSDPGSDRPFLTPDLVGVYEAELLVSDATGLTSLLPDRAVVTAVPAERLLIELVWDSPVADLDLHMLAPGGTLGSRLDCYYGNRRPDWGEPGDPLDDPALKRDDLAGFGPETIGYEQPAGGAYQLLVDYFAAHTPSGREPTTATLRVFVDGILEAEMTRRLEAQGQLWTAGSVLWPEGTVSEVDVLE